MIGKIKNLMISLAALLTIGALAPAAVLAATDCSNPANADSAACQVQGGVNNAGGTDSATSSKSISDTLATIINIFSMIIGIISVFVIIIGGLNYITSGGNDQKTAQAKQTILYAVIGLIIVAMAQLIVQFAINTGTANSGSKAPPASQNPTSTGTGSSPGVSSSTCQSEGGTIVNGVCEL